MYIIVTDFLVVNFIFIIFFLSIVSILVTQLIMVISFISIYCCQEYSRSNLVHSHNHAVLACIHICFCSYGILS